VLDGYDATRQINAPPGLAAIPIIAVSSFAMKGDDGACLGLRRLCDQTIQPRGCAPPRTALLGGDGTALMTGLWVRFRSKCKWEKLLLWGQGRHKIRMVATSLVPHISAEVVALLKLSALCQIQTHALQHYLWTSCSSATPGQPVRRSWEACRTAARYRCSGGPSSSRRKAATPDPGRVIYNPLIRRA
jgi:CheY-like chemotaxis protein